ncbi:MAG: O-antigen ligase family protein, partial [Clostridia bacterium]|nr:O-antigen ligase family protein [Clostridia bacterium]
VALSAAFCLSGIFYSHYTVMNLLYGLALSAIIIIFYVFCYCNFELEEKTFSKIASYFIAVAATVTLELIVAYITCRSEGAEKGWRNVLSFGWGTYNQAGLMLTMAIPAWFYLAGKHKKGYYFLLGAVVNEAMCMLSQSRQAMLMSAVVFAACCVWILIWDKGRKRVFDLIMMGVVLVLLAIIVGVFHKQLIEFVSGAVDKSSLATGSGRTTLWKQGWHNFLHKPLFGVGFYDPTAKGTYDEAGELLTSEVGFFTPGDLSHSIPRMCHNTVFQLLSSCGLVGLAVYVFHRVQTVISFINNVTAERTLIALTMCVLLLMSLLDNHLFYFITTIQYSILLSLLAVTEKKKQVNKKKTEQAEPTDVENKNIELNKEELAN